ncbi:MAG: M1 family metallopeptidase [Chitinophagaceae bacterium]|nr:M1 family metallopeptidase [Chitinophagaceae bacterium]
MFLISGLTALSQYWQQQVNYVIDVSLNDQDHSLDGFAEIEYINNSPDTLHFIWFHLWPNAYKNDKTAFSEHMLENGKTAFYFSSKDDKGYINRLDFKVNKITAQTEDHPQYIDIIKVILPMPVSPKQKTIITTPFHVKLPYNFSRGGHEGQSYQATQWYPKPAVYDKTGWNEMPYLDQGEFYSEFGNFKVNITVPRNYVVAATGNLQNTEETEWLKTRSNFLWTPVTKKEKSVYGQVKKTIQQFPESSKEIKTVSFIQHNIHDFAWFADKRFIVKQDTITLVSGKKVAAFTYYTKAERKAWQNALQACKDAVQHYSTLVGEYPYNTVSVVEGPKSFGGGMEYPTITVISPMENTKVLDNTITHEVGHNWFYGILGSNERLHPWMDEGFNSFYDAKYDSAKYGSLNTILERLLFERTAKVKTDQPITTSAADFSYQNYFLTAYYKTAEWMRDLESYLGTEAFTKAMQAYFQQWQFKHPQPGDFKKTIETTTGKNLDSVFALLQRKGTLPSQKRSGTKFATLIVPKTIASQFKQPSKNLIWTSPVIGTNSYDKFMAGLAISNMKIVPSKFQFLFAQMYATGSKKISGLGLASLTFYTNKGFAKKIDFGITAGMFSYNDFTDDFESRHIAGYKKIVPNVKITVREKSHRSTATRYIQFKSFLFSEDEFNFFADTVYTNTGTTTGFRAIKVNETRVLQQLKFIVENNRALYPYRGELKLEHGKDFAKAAFTGNYFFNYPKGGGLKLRLFAGKFFYTTSKTTAKQFATDRYHLNMTGTNGYEDYTYSDYFIGRNRFEGMASQQIMEKDGAFKVRTDLLADKVGRTDDWLMAVNFSTSIPDKINPLSVLPFKIPLKLFLDIGTYSKAWKKEAEIDRFIFDAGLHLPLFKETVNIYLPLLYSSVYKDYIQSTLSQKGRLWKTISFSIDISNFSLKKVQPYIPF